MLFGNCKKLEEELKEKNSRIQELESALNESNDRC